MTTSLPFAQDRPPFFRPNYNLENKSFECWKELLSVRFLCFLSRLFYLESFDIFFLSLNYSRVLNKP